MSNKASKENVKAFVKRWTGKGYEKGECQKFWLDLLANVLDVENSFDIIDFEMRVKYEHFSFIDAYIKPTNVLIEQKSSTRDIKEPTDNVDAKTGKRLTAFQQVMKYASELPYSMRPRWVVICNFKSFLIYDMEQPLGEPFEILLENLPKEAHMLKFLIEDKSTMQLKHEIKVSMQAGEIVGKLYDAFLAQYHGNATEKDLHNLNVLCVRLVFCLWAEDADVFDKNQFGDYLQSFKPENMRIALRELFRVLDTPGNERDPFLEDKLKEFPYVNGSLFHQETDERIPNITEQIADLLINHASRDFDWSDISPTIFGALFESTLNPETRRAGGMHYTSIENIHKVINPLFMDNLSMELDKILIKPKGKPRKQKLLEYQDKLASLTFLDPACGSGNFLTETYISLRRLENKILQALYGKGNLALINPIKVKIQQFYGIEINDFAVSVAKTALWIAEAQMMNETESIIKFDNDYLPLKSYNNITEGNALRVNWEDVVPKDKLSYIIGNPPFVGARMMDAEQKKDILDVFGPKWKNAGNLDYVACWYKKASDYITDTNICCALVSTNSICQGESVANLWKPLFDDGTRINFAYRTFRWDSESNQKAHVHCVIVSFCKGGKRKNIIFDNARIINAKNINGYLIDSDNVWIESRTEPLCDVPEIGIGNKPVDGGFYLFTKEEMNDFVDKEPASKVYFKRWYGAVEFINNKERFCLWLGDCSPSKLKSMPQCYLRVSHVKEFRLSSKSEGTRKIADRPTRFHVENMPKTTYILLPQTSSINRRYIPMGFMTPDALCSNAVRVIPDATLYHFGVLTSNIHMAWVRAICGRLKSDYQYSGKHVYNNFPWPTPTPEQQAKIEQTAQAILDARALYPDSSLADLYDLMPPELLKAHRENDKAVMQAYGFPIKDFTESDCVAELFKMYKAMTEGKNKIYAQNIK